MKRKALLIGKMAEKQISRKDMAARMGMTVGTLNIRLNGQKDFRLGEAFLICEILGIPDGETMKYFND